MILPEATAVPDFRHYRVLLDKPADDPALGFDDYARAFADIIRHSPPRFAIGIFGDWGSGKTTLMEAIARELDSNDSVIPVWFNAWRYEREEHLIVPLLDTLREGLAQWASAHSAEREKQGQAVRAAATVGRAARALFAGLSMKATIGVASVELDPQRAMDSWREDDASAAESPLSFYHASFNAMRDAIEKFVGGSDRRIVVYVDDLDRCLPLSALEVLESLKLFFDMPGFVFVVGLDQDVIERSVELKYARGGSAGDAAAASNGDLSGAAAARGATAITGTDYIKKIFQVPFSLPPISRDDLRPFFDALVEGGDLPAEQKQHLHTFVAPHLEESTGASAGAVNPREVKRLVNAYTLQMKMLSSKVRENVNPHVVLAIQTMAFRSEWQPLYDLLTADPQRFTAAVSAVLNDNTGRTRFALRSEPLPPGFLAYIGGVAGPLLEEPNLDVYITSAETTASSDPRIGQARAAVSDLERLLERVGSDGTLSEEGALGELSGRLSQLQSQIEFRTPPSFFADEAKRLTHALQEAASEIKNPSSDPPDAPPPWVAKIQDLLTKLDENLRELRRQTHVGALA